MRGLVEIVSSFKENHIAHPCPSPHVRQQRWVCHGGSCTQKFFCYFFVFTPGGCVRMSNSDPPRASIWHGATVPYTQTPLLWDWHFLCRCLCRCRFRTVVVLGLFVALWSRSYVVCQKIKACWVSGMVWYGMVMVWYGMAGWFLSLTSKKLLLSQACRTSFCFLEFVFCAPFWLITSTTITSIIATSGIFLFFRFVWRLCGQPASFR